MSRTVPTPTTASLAPERVTATIRAVRRRRDREATWTRRLAAFAEGFLVLVVGVAIVAVGLIAVHGRDDVRPALIALTAGAETLPPRDLMAAAADALEAARAPGGSGYRFRIVQTSAMVARPGGPKVPVPADTGRGTSELVDRYYLHSLLEEGVARPDGFWSRMRAGPADEGAAPDWTGSQVMFEALVRGQERWRDDGEGWYRAEDLPGIGLDPETAGLLPTLLRDADDPRDAEDEDAATARALRADATREQIPGVIAADGLAFTELLAPLTYGFDAGGRLTRIAVSARNTNMDDFDLVIETTVEIAYDDVAGLPTPQRFMEVAP